MYKRWGISVTYYDQQNSLPAFKAEWPEFVELGSQAVQATLKRVDLDIPSSNLSVNIQAGHIPL